MVTTIYLVRHAAAEGNITKVFQGHTDAPLCELGILQLSALKKRFCEVELDAIFSSPLKRAMQTAKAVNSVLPLELRPRLIEIDGGGFEGVPYVELPVRFPEEYDKWSFDLGRFHAPAGEDINDVYARISDEISLIAEENLGKTVAVVSHGCVIRAFLCFAKGLPVTEIMNEAWADNTAVAKLEYSEGKFNLIFENDACHLDESTSTFARQDWWKPRKKNDYFSG